MMHYSNWKAAHDGVTGWFSDMSAGIVDAFLDYQDQKGIPGDLMEIGVAHGRSASLINLHARTREHFIAVDCNAPLLEEAAALLRGQGTGQVIVHGCDSQALPAEDFRQGCVRFMHIDGDHGRGALLNDLTIADQVVGPEGLLVLDDFLAPQYLAATAGVFEWLTLHPKRFEMVLAGHNKAYLARPEAARDYLFFIRDQLPAQLRARGTTDFTFWRMAEPEDWRGFGVAGRQWNRDFVGLREDVNEPERPAAERFAIF
ncbi:class I SAM-dependent methyltransferase [Rhodovarius crocodyli]|uniref:Class I SAM-dependent methyltransferase n=1 Tax=Rhodovarius crocodyli TaxID=1979269 RepID=A0A437M254_9PROT|nr:class I SAM-dependent methyltransferase [Rhodovarius crocodyli]RVT91594.1 class I SAM-dependent methyltransferase [Rhodovarius crocodyli]